MNLLQSLNNTIPKLLKIVLTLSYVFNNIISNPLLRVVKRGKELDLPYTWNNKDDDSWHLICISECYIIDAL